MHTTHVFSGGPAGDPPPVLGLFDGPADLVIAADSGLHLAQDLGVAVDLVVGDLDSVDPDRLERAVRAGARVSRHPVDKDATDLELAVDAALEAGTDRLRVLASSAGRLDHLLGLVSVLTAPRLAGIDVAAVAGPARLVVVRDDAELHGEPGGLVSLLAVGGPADGVTTEGLAWALDGETLPAGSSRGLSNRFLGGEARVKVGAGCVLAVIPGGAS